MEELVASSLGYTINKEQLDVVVQFYKSIAIVSTRFGKSLSFAYLPGAFNRLHCIKEDDLHKSFVIAVSPLVALLLCHITINCCPAMLETICSLCF